MNICGLHDEASRSSKEQLRIQSTKRYKNMILSVTAASFILHVMTCYKQQFGHITGVMQIKLKKQNKKQKKKKPKKKKNRMMD